jgi:hypothetical protein
MTGTSRVTGAPYNGRAGILITIDGGSTWVLRENLGGMYVQNDVLVTYLNQRLFSVRLLYSSDFGVTWKSLGDGFPYFQPGGREPGIRFLGKTEDSLVFQVVVAPDRGLYECSLR